MKSNPFQFCTKLDLVEGLGKKAKNLPQLLEGLKTVPGSSIYYHTHRFLQQHHFLSPEPPNDFAYWITYILQEKEFGEKISSVDIMQFRTIRQLREKFILLIEEYIKQNKELRNAPEGCEFHFMKSISFVLKTKYIVLSLEEFYQILKRISIPALYFHMFDARLRLEKETNDFSFWLETSLGEVELAKKISSLDPYTQTLEGLRNKICGFIEKRLYDR